MDCPSCGHPNTPEAGNCPACGEPSWPRCSHCGRAAPADAAYCPSCGRRLRDRAETPAAPEGAPLGRAERRTATVLFSDLSGYTALNEALDPEDVALVMGQIKDAATRIVESHGGMVNQFVGDQVMALFGVPTAHDDDPVRAVQAALALHAFVRELAVELAPRVGRRLSLHTSVNSGLLVAERRDQREGVFAVTGDAINTGARLVEVAGADEVVVGPATYRAVTPFFATVSLGPVPLRGKLEPVEVHRILGVVARTRFEAAQRRGLTPLVGRAREIALLRASLCALSEGRGGLVTVSGQPGIGKSRIFHEFREVAESESTFVHQARCEPFGLVAPYAPFVELLRDGLGLRKEDSADELIAKSVDRIRAIGGGLEQHLAVFLHLLSLRSEAHAVTPATSGEALRQAIHRALEALLMARAAERPVVLLLEDWHCADPASELALRHLLRLLPEQRVLFAINFRSHFRPEWIVEQRTAVELEPLAIDETEALIQALLERDVPAPWLRSLCERTGGNPFFIEEACRAVSESGVLRSRPNSQALESALRLPETVEAVVRARIDRLDPRSLSVLRMASVLGRDFTLPLLRRLESGEDLSSCLARLGEAELVEEVRLGSEIVHRFRHGITQQVAYESLLRRDRRALHDSVGRAIETHFAGPRLEAHFEELAHHFSLGDDRSRALFYLECAGSKAAASFALEQARANYAAAVGLLAQLEPTRERAVKRIDLTFRWGQAGWYGPTAEQIAALDQAQCLARELGDRDRELHSIYFTGWLLYTMGDSARAIECFERCIAMADPADARMLSQLYCNLGQNLASDVDYDRALAYLEKGIALRKQAFPESWRTIGMAYALAYMALVEADRGDFEASERHMQEALAIIAPMAHGSALSSINQVRAMAAVMRGDFENALEHAALGRRLANEIGAPPNYAMALAIEGWARFRGRGDKDGIETLLDGLRQMEAAGTQLAASLYLACLGEALARAGEGARGAEYARLALERARWGDRIGETAGWRALALAQLRGAAGGWEGACISLERARELAQAKGSPRELALTELVSAECLRERGEPRRACEHVERAVANLHALRMPWYEARARELAASLAG